MAITGDNEVVETFQGFNRLFKLSDWTHFVVEFTLGEMALSFKVSFVTTFPVLSLLLLIKGQGKS